jgi:hypothetical protein
MEQQAEKKNDDQQSQQQQVVEPIEQETIPFHGEQIIAVKLADGRIAVVLRWVCASLKIDPQAQVRRIQRTAAISGELLRVKVQTGGGRQTMPALTLRGFPTWILGLNPGEVKEDLKYPEQAERIRRMIIAYQVEAVDVLYNHFANKAQAALPTPAATAIVAERSVSLAPGADDQTLATYYESLSVWALWKASQHAQAWRGQVEERLDGLQAQLEGEKAVTDLIPEILERLGEPKINAEQQTNIRGIVKRLADLSGIPYQTIYWELAQAFQAPRYSEILASQYPAALEWFNRRIEQAKKDRRGKL